MNKLMTEADIDKAIEEIDEIVSKKLLELEQTEKNLRAAVLAEREACAKLIEDFEPESFYLGQLKNAAEAIRARSQA
jgi:hypothetical protein